MEKAVIEIDGKALNAMFDALCKNAFEQLHDNHNSWKSENPFTGIVRAVFHENEEAIKKVMSEYVMEIIRDDKFFDLVRVEYSALMAQAMLAKLDK